MTIDFYGRHCKNCKVYKKWELYYLDNTVKSGYRSICKACDKDIRKGRKPKKRGKKFNDISLEGFCQIKQDFYLSTKKAGKGEPAKITNGAKAVV